MFSDKEVDKKVKYKLGIFDGHDPKESDLDKVTEIIISNLNAKGEVIGTDVSEIGRLTKLKTLGLRGFDLSAELVELIHRFPELVSLNLYECHSQEPITIDIETLKSLILDHCQVANFSDVRLPENVLIVNGGVINVSEFKKSSSLKDLGIKNSDIVNASSLSDIKGLKNLNLDGSTLDNEDIISELKSRKIVVSHEYEYNPMR